MHQEEKLKSVTKMATTVSSGKRTKPESRFVIALCVCLMGGGLLVSLGLVLSPALARAQEQAQEQAQEPVKNPAQAETASAPDGATRTHALSLFGEVKYQAGFEHFDYVNTDAPKGGRLRLSGIGGFDSLNRFAVKGEFADGLPLIYDSLLTQSLDEPASQYPLLAERVELADDYSWSIFTLREGARWHDGRPITPDDVIFSLNALREGLPLFRYYYQNIVSAEKLDGRRVKFTYDQAGNRELPFITGEMIVLPKHYWQGTDASGNPRDITKSTLEPPLGSGPYRIGTVQPGNSISYVRVPDYWGKDLPVNVGKNNFDEIEFIYFRDQSVAFEAFFADAYDFRLENKAQNWAEQYDSKPAVKAGEIIKEAVPSKDIGAMQGFFFNTRRDQFKDPRVRQALGLVYNFEWANQNLFHGQYKRLNSFFDNSELAATGLPSPAELELLEPFRDQLPPQVFEQGFKSPVSDGSTANRDNLRKAIALLQEAGWTLRNGRMMNAQGQQLSFTFLLVSPTFERVVQPFIRDLERIGVDADIRIVDTSQYEQKIETFDFDVIVFSVPQSHSPGNEQRDFWGSAAADRQGSRNVAGIRDPVVDALIEHVVFAEDREALVTATRALDRVLLWSHYVIPHWYTDVDRIAYWNRLSRPENLPGYSLGMPQIWWSNEAAGQSP